MPFDMDTFLAQVTTRTNVTRVPRGEVVFKIGDAADQVFYLQRGSIKLNVVSETGREAVLGLILPGQFFGQETLSGQKTRTATATAIVASTVIDIRRHIFAGLLAAEPAFSEAFMLDLLERHQRIEADVMDHLFNSSEKRLARVLLMLAHYGARREPEPILGAVTHDLLARKVGTTRPRVSYFMSKFRKLGFITYDGSITVNPALLNAVLHDWPEDGRTALRKKKSKKKKAKKRKRAI